jgi:uncharacterized membrane protein YphA (DoxX/SURF4 family)
MVFCSLWKQKNNNMNTALWILQSLIAAAFLYSGTQKSLYSEQKLVAIGQTGVEGLPIALIRFIGVSEILGTIGIILPMLLHILPILTTISAICFAVIMIPAAIIHYKRHEFRNVFNNCVLFLICVFVAYGRTYLAN